MFACLPGQFSSVSPRKRIMGEVDRMLCIVHHAYCSMRQCSGYVMVVCRESDAHMHHCGMIVCANGAKRNICKAGDQQTKKLL